MMERISANGLVVVTVGVRAGVAVIGEVVGENVVVSRQPPNHPYFIHEVVGRSDVDVDVEELDEVVVSSRHPGKVSCCSEASHDERYTYPTIQAFCKSQSV